MTGRRLWSNYVDRECLTRPGPSAWHRCSHCGHRWRAIGRYVRRTTRGYACPGCRLRREGRALDSISQPRTAPTAWRLDGAARTTHDQLGGAWQGRA